MILVIVAVIAVVLVPTVVFADPSSPPEALSVNSGFREPEIASLSWAPPADLSAVKYRIYSATSAEGPWGEVATTNELAYSFTDGFGGIDYYFRVASINEDGAESSAAQVGPARALWLESPHAPATRESVTCTRCHSAHSAQGALLARKGEFTDVSVSQMETCYGCHGGKSVVAANVESGAEDSFALKSGHSVEGKDSEDLTKTCASCHELHLNPATSAMIPRAKINGNEVSGNDNTWCYACHEEADSDYPGTGTARVDGYPVSGRWPGSGTYKSDTNPHNKIPAVADRVEGSCLNCHSAHRGSNEFDGLRSTYRAPSASTLTSDQAEGAYAAACLDCHGTTTPTGFETAPTNIKQFVTTETVSAATTSTAGHRIVTVGGDLPVGSPLPCFECHNPHGSREGNTSLISDARGGSLETSTAAGVRQFCFTCHTPYDSGAGWDSESSDYVSVNGEEVVGLSRTDFDTALRLSGVDAHNQDNGQSCYDCHGDSYAPGGSNVHNPSKGPSHKATTAESIDCASCHVSTDVIEVHSDTQGCETCHGEPDISVGKTVECVSCHENKLEPHGYELEDHTADLGSGDVELFDTHPDIPQSIRTNVECATCHSSDIGAIHNNRCSTCHPAPRNTFQTWEGGCQQGGCHEVIHEDSAASHAYINDPDSDVACETCHEEGADTPGGDIRPDACAGCHATYDPNDTTLPETTSTAQASYIGPARIEFSIRIGGKIGLGTTFYKLDDQPVASGSSVIVEAVGSHTIEYWSVDQNGNKETAKQAEFTVLPDFLPPTTESSAADGAAFYGATTIALTATDNNVLGVKNTYYRLSVDGVQGPLESGTTVSIPAASNTIVAYTLTYWSEDWSGNMEPHQTVDFTVAGGTGTIRLTGWDGSPPEGVIAEWFVSSGPPVGSIDKQTPSGRSSDYSDWNGIINVTVPLRGIGYYVTVRWIDPALGTGDWDGVNGFSDIKITTPGQVEDLTFP